MLTMASIATVRVPTWVTPVAFIVVTSVLLPNTSFLGHLCAVVVGYLCKSGYSDWVFSRRTNFYQLDLDI